MFESSERLRRDVSVALETLRALGGGRYAAVFEATSVVAESPAETGAAERALGLLVRAEAAALLRLPAALAAGHEMSDLFAEWTSEEFLLAVVNGRVGVLVACEDAAALEAESARLLRALVDLLLRLDSRFRHDERGRGLFFGRPRLDTVVIPRPAPDGTAA
jgi:hypothetical protein